MNVLKSVARLVGGLFGRKSEQRVVVDEGREFKAPARRGRFRKRTRREKAKARNEQANGLARSEHDVKLTAAFGVSGR